jgi:hypothetical protein
MQWLFDSTGGRKMTLGILGILSVLTLAVLKIIDGTTAVDTIKWMVVGVTGALAVSDIGNSLKKPEVLPVVPQVLPAPIVSPDTVSPPQ